MTPGPLLLRVLQGIGNDPVPADKLYGLRSLISNADRVLYCTGTPIDLQAAVNSRVSAAT
jgi:hypothetical protein